MKIHWNPNQIETSAIALLKLNVVIVVIVAVTSVLLLLCIHSYIHTKKEKKMRLFEWVSSGKKRNANNGYWMLSFIAIQKSKFDSC